MISWKKNIFVLFLILLPITVLLRPFLFGDNVIVQKYVTEQALPFNAYFDNHFDGHLPLWSDSHGHGFPMYLTQAGHTLHPVILILFKLFNYITAYHLFIFFNFFVSGAATYLLARRMGMSLWAGIISCFVYIFSHISVWAHAITGLGIMLSFMPVFLLCVFEMRNARNPIKQPGKSGCLNWFRAHKKKILMPLTALLVFLAWISGYVEGVLYIFVMGLFFALFLDVSFYQKDKQNISFLKSLKTTIAVIICLILGTVLASAYIAPVINFLDETRRGAAVASSNMQGISDFIENSTLRLDKIIQLFYPYFSMPYGEYVPFLNTSQEDGYLYVGILPLFLGAVAFLNLRKNKISLFFALFFIFALLTFLPYIPLNWLLHRMPFMERFKDYWKWVYVLVFCWSMLAGFGFDAIKELYQNKTKQLKRMLGFFEAVFSCVLFAAIFANFIFIFFKNKLLLSGQNYFNARVGEDAGLSDAVAVMDTERARGFIEQALNSIQQNISFSNPHFSLAIGIVFATFLLFVLFRKERISLKKFKFFCAVLVILNLFLIWQGFYKTIPSGLLLNPPSTARFLIDAKSAGEPFRVARFPLNLRYDLDYGIKTSDVESRIEFDIALLFPDYNLYYDISTIFGGDGLRTLRHEKMSSYTIGGLVAENINNKSVLEGTGQKMAEDERIRALDYPFSRNLLSMMNVKYLLTPLKLPSTWILVHESVVTKYKIPAYIYENPEVLPKIYFAKTIKITPKGDDSAFAELQKVKSFKETTIIECDNTLCLSVNPQNISSKDALEIRNIDFDYLKLKTTTKTPRWLVYSQPNFPTWEVKIDGKSTDIYTANYLYQAVYIPAGEHEIEYKYPGFFKQFYYALRNLTEER